MNAAPLLRRLSAAAALAAFVAAAWLPTGCATKVETTPERICTAGAYVYCRCQDRSDGTKLCNADGTAFGACEPCERWDNPEWDPDDDDYDPPPLPRDGGPDAPFDPDAVCGDGIVQAGEDCDDANQDDTDGCDRDCTLAGGQATVAQNCPGLEVHVWGGAHAPTFTGTTVGSGNRQTTPNCTNANSGTMGNPTSGANASDRIFKVIPHKSGQLTAKTTDASFNNFLYASQACSADLVSWLACRNDNDSFNPDFSGESITFPVDAGKAYYVFVDGAGISNHHGTFRVTFSMP
jgi:cysteine-rich repeat protein